MLKYYKPTDNYDNTDKDIINNIKKSNIIDITCGDYDNETLIYYEDYILRIRIKINY